MRPGARPRGPRARGPGGGGAGGRPAARARGGAARPPGAAAYVTLAALRRLVAALARQPGRRMLLLASGGFSTAGLELPQDALIEAASRSRVALVALDVAAHPHPVALATLANLAASTAGRYLAYRSGPLQGLAGFRAWPAPAYRLALDTGAVAHDGRFHRLQVELAAPGAGTVPTRRGYYAPPPEGSVAALRARMDAALRAGRALGQVPAALSARVHPGRVAATVALDLRRLRFDHHGGWYQDLYFVAGLYRPDGRFVSGEQGEMDLTLSDATRRRLRARGLKAVLALGAAPGRYQLRVVVGAFSGGALFASRQAVVVP